MRRVRKTDISVRRIVVVLILLVVVWAGRAAWRAASKQFPMPAGSRIVFSRVLTGVFTGPSNTRPQVTREFWIYRNENDPQPLRSIPEINSEAGSRGPVFMVGNYDPVSGEILFRTPVWLEVRARYPNESESQALKPRVRISTAGRLASGAHLAEVSGVGMSAVLGAYSHLRRGFAGRTFDSTLWKRIYPQENRATMLQDLLNHHELYGQTTTQVLELLGPPAPPGFPFGAAGWDMVYKVGWYGIDNTWLFLGLDHDRVAQLRIYTD